MHIQVTRPRLLRLLIYLWPHATQEGAGGTSVGRGGVAAGAEEGGPISGLEGQL